VVLPPNGFIEILNKYIYNILNTYTPEPYLFFAMQNLIIKMLTIPFQLMSLMRKLKNQKQFIEIILPELLSELHTKSGKELNEATIIKMKKYYGLYVPMVLGEAFCKLHNKTFVESDRMAFTYMGLLSVVADDFFDNRKLDDSYIASLVEETPDLPDQSSDELFFKMLIKKLIVLLDSRDELFEYAEKVYLAQVESKKQMLEGTSLDEITTITAEKGGYSFLLYRIGLAEPLGIEEKKMVFALGDCMQWANDIFDMHKDYKDGIRTLATETIDVFTLESNFQNKINHLRKLLQETPFRGKAIQAFFGLLSLTVFSRTYVCFNHLKKAQKTTQNAFHIDAYEREQLVCDMEKPGNVVLGLWYYITQK